MRTCATLITQQGRVVHLTTFADSLRQIKTTNMADEAFAPTDGLSPEQTETAPESTSETETLGALTEEKHDTVPLKKYMETKRSAADAEERARVLETELAKVKSNLTSMSVPAVNDELTRLAQEHNADPELLAKLMGMAKNVTAAEIKRELDQEYAPTLSRIEAERSQERAEKKFDDLYSKTLKDMGEYDGIVNKDVLKSLAFNPANAKKTLPQILEEAYGNAVSGRKSIESSHPGSRSADDVDLTNPNGADFDRINADPSLKAKWASQAEAQIRQYL